MWSKLNSTCTRATPLSLSLSLARLVCFFGFEGSLFVWAGVGRGVPFCLHKKSMTSKVCIGSSKLPSSPHKTSPPSSFSLPFLSSPHVSRRRSLDFHVSQYHQHLFGTLIYQHPILVFPLKKNPIPRHHAPPTLSLSPQPSFSYFDPDASILVLLLFSKFIHQIKNREKRHRESKERRKLKPQKAVFVCMWRSELKSTHNYIHV